MSKKDMSIKIALHFISGFVEGTKSTYKKNPLINAVTSNTPFGPMGFIVKGIKGGIMGLMSNAKK